MHAPNLREKFVFRKNAEAKRKIYISKRHTERKKRIRERRANNRFRLLNNKRRAKCQKIAGQNNGFKTEENKRRAEALKVKPKQEEYKEEESIRNALRIPNGRDKYKNNFDVMKSSYELKINEGAIPVYSCCGGLWFEHSIREFTVEMLTRKGFIDSLLSQKYNHQIMCHVQMLNNVPNLCLSDGLAFYGIPGCLKILTELEQRSISPRISFMVIGNLSNSKQFGLKGILVNVPMNVDTNVSILLRTFSDTQTIQLKLIR